MTCDVLLSFGPDDAAVAESLTERLRQQGWTCAAGGSSAQPRDAAAREYRALAVLVSEASMLSPFVLRDTERAAGRNVPIFPMRLDDAPLTPSFEYFIGTIGAADARRNFDAAAKALIAAIHTRLDAPASAFTSKTHGRGAPLFDAAPPFRPRPLLRRWAGVFLAVVWTLALVMATGLVFSAGGVASASLIRTVCQVAGFPGGFLAYLLVTWFHSAHRNLLALGVTGTRHRGRELVWRMVAFPVSLFTAPAIIRQLQDRTPGPVASRWRRRLRSWSWNGFILGYVAGVSVPAAAERAALPLIAVTAATQIISVPLLWLVISDVSRRQMHARASRHRARAAGEQTAGGAQTVLVSYAAQDRAAAEVLCEALEARGIDCWLARRDATWDARAIHAFGTVVVLLSANLEASTATLAELELAIADGATVLPLRLDQTPVPAAFRYLLGSIHWFDDEGSSFDQQTDTILQLIRRRHAAAAPAPDGLAEDYRVGQRVVTDTARRHTHRLFYTAAFVYVSVALLTVAALAVRLLRQPAVTDGAAASFVTVTIWRIGLGLVCFAGRYWWQRTADVTTPRRTGWPLVFASSTLGALPAAIAASRGHAVVAIVIDSAVSLLGIVALILTVLGVRAAVARHRQEQRERNRAAQLLQRTTHEPVRFDAQVTVQRGFRNLVIGGTIGNVLLWLIDIAIVQDLARNGTKNFATSSLPQIFTVQTLLILVPTSVLFLVWLAVAYRNLEALGIHTHRYSAAVAVRRFLNPLVNVIVAVPIVIDLRHASARDGALLKNRTLWIAGWWAAILLYWAALWWHLATIVVSSPTLVVASGAAICATYALSGWTTYRLIDEISTLQRETRTATR